MRGRMERDTVESVRHLSIIFVIIVCDKDALYCNSMMMDGWMDGWWW